MINLARRDKVLYAKVILFTVIYGWTEQYLFRHGVVLDQNLFNHFSWYHAGVGLLFFVVCYPAVQLLPLMALLEDINFFFWHPTASLNPDSWVNWGLGGFHLFSIWIPTIYLILIAIYIGAEVGVHYFHRRDG